MAAPALLIVLVVGSVMLSSLYVIQNPEIFGNPPPPDPQCESGYHYNAELGQCIADNPPVGDTIAPTVSITSPVNGATLKAGTTSVQVAGTAADNVGVTLVVISVNNAPYAPTGGTSSWGATVNGLHDGYAYIIKARAKDAAGNFSQDKTVTIMVNNPTSTVDQFGVTKIYPTR